MQLCEGCAASAVVHYKLGQLEQSQDHYARAYDIQARPVTLLMSWQVSACLLVGSSQCRLTFKAASSPLVQALQLGTQHPDVAVTMANTAGLLKAMGKHGEAETVYRTVRPCTPDDVCTLYS